MKLRLLVFDLPLRHTFRTSRSAVDVQPTLIVELAQGHHRGYGEAISHPYYGVGLEAMAAALDAVRPILAERELTDPAQLWDDLHPHLEAHRFAHCALDEAAHDLWGKLRGQSVHRLWGLEARNLPPTNYTIGIDTIEVMAAKMAELPGWPVYKIKLGTPDDLEIVRELRSHTDATLRVDANCAWSVEETLANAEAMKELGVEFIEQPLAADDLAAMEGIFRESALPVIADESCRVESDVDRCHRRFHGINIKLVKCGGLTPARRMITHARDLGMGVMVGCMTESTVGISAIAQLLPLLDYVDMDGALLLARDIAEGVSIEQGHCRYPDTPGCGVRLLEPGREILPANHPIQPY
jgi:L-alanine-DL-glutamate epimerase-like enolase superfamily enzyme